MHEAPDWMKELLGQDVRFGSLPRVDHLPVDGRDFGNWEPVLEGDVYALSISKADRAL